MLEDYPESIIILYLAFPFFVGLFFTSVGGINEDYKLFNNLSKVIFFPFAIGVLVARAVDKVYARLKALKGGYFYNLFFGDMTFKPKFRVDDIVSLIPKGKSNKSIFVYRILEIDYRRAIYKAEILKAPTVATFREVGTTVNLPMEEEEHYSLDKSFINKETLDKETKELFT